VRMIEVIVEHCPNLRKLVINVKRNLKRKQKRKLTKGLKMLENLEVNGVIVSLS
jgi:hypothetical protein